MPANPNHMARAPKHTPSALVKGKPLIFAVMETEHPARTLERAALTGDAGGVPQRAHAPKGGSLRRCRRPLLACVTAAFGTAWVFVVGTPELREAPLERYLRTVRYARWAWRDEDPLELSLLALHDYMRGVGVPTHEYSRVAEAYVHLFNVPPAAWDPEHLSAARNITMSTRAYTRVVLRLRAQAEREAADAAAAKAAGPPVPPKKRITNNGPSRTSSRAPSSTSGYSHSQSHASAAAPPAVGAAFRSPLFRVKRAPLLRVFVPSPDGDWLSDKSVLECEAELNRAGILGLLRMGDVLGDIAVGDEGNVGRLVWDGSTSSTWITSTSQSGTCPSISRLWPSRRRISIASYGRVPASTNPVDRVQTKLVISPPEKTPIPACTAMILIRRLPFDIALQIFTARCVYDGRKKIFSIHKLKFDTGSQEFDLTLADESPSAPGKGPKVYKIKLTLVAEFNPEV
ncbi:hypothetical protein K438DRAFT_2003524 [Mycena galopus ATCC 62051]|nr:hypothetical protein K438DRAFT_2003524 [Mycena galopus ATCC 62051]